mmetsp:Transcript_16971/g.41129  ORF Transcript_16971/g.41129 Transcript_16971/m.41129 type:complete len:234 (+) Transcript_16971:1722-2423(+)
MSMFTTDRPCYCNIESLTLADRDRPPTKKEFEDYFLSRLTWLDLFDEDATWSPAASSSSSDTSPNPTETANNNSSINDFNITLPDDCDEILFNQTNFTALVVARVSSDILCATEEELIGLGQVFLWSYNSLNVFNDVMCDRNWRLCFLWTSRRIFRSAVVVYLNKRNHERIVVMITMKAYDIGKCSRRSQSSRPLHHQLLHLQHFPKHRLLRSCKEISESKMKKIRTSMYCSQ